MTHAVSPTAGAPVLQDQPQAAPAREAPPPVVPSVAQAAAQLAASAVNMTPASMAALIQAQANLSQSAPAMIREHTAENIGQMIWRLDDAPALSPAPLAVRQLEVARAALSQSLVDLRA
jgi:hypothetical protein